VARTYGEYLTVKAANEDDAWQLAHDNDETCEYEVPNKDNCTEHTVCIVELWEGK
jgi:hypothetical protein